MTLAHYILFDEIATTLKSLPANSWSYSTSNITPKDRGGRVTLHRYSTSLKEFEFNLDRERTQTSHQVYDAAGEGDGQQLAEYNVYRLNILRGEKSVAKFDDVGSNISELFVEIDAKVKKYLKENRNTERANAISRLQKLVGGTR